MSRDIKGKSNMNILGIIDGQHDATACILRDGKLVAATAEERIARVKMLGGFPYKAIKDVLGISGMTEKDIDAVAVGSMLTPPLFARLFRGVQKTEREVLVDQKPGLMSIVSEFVKYRLKLTVISPESFLGMIQRPFLKMVFRRSMPKGLKKKPLYLVNHHLAHAAAAYFNSGKRDCLVISADCWGDGLSLAIYECRKGDMKRIYTMDAMDSLGHFYASITKYLGFKPFRHEGKITGLAAFGDAKSVKIPYPFAENKGRIAYTLKNSLDADSKLKKQLDEYRKEDVAAWLQDNMSKWVVNVASRWIRKTELYDVVLVGGLFANVKFNQAVHEIRGVKSIYIFPEMGDGGLSVGAACQVYSQKNKDYINRAERLENVYLGKGYTNKEIEAELKKNKLSYRKVDEIEKEIARLVSNGKVVARFNGRMEFGPRALGNRSILYHAKDPDVNKWLNKRLKRCYDEKTEILTSEGWKFMKDVRDGEIVATLNQRKNMLEFQKILGRTSYYHDGIMYRIKNNRIDLLVTPNHNMWVKKKHSNRFGFIKIDDVYDIKTYHYGKKGGIEWKGVETRHFLLPAVKSTRKSFPSMRMPMNLWLEFFGYWLSEGSAYFDRRGHYRVSIAQSRMSRYFNQIKGCLSRLGFNFRYDKKKEFIIYSKQLYTYLLEFGKAHQKYIPREFLELSRPQLRILFESLMRGDGNIRGNGFRYATTSRRLADDVQELALKLGLSAYISVQKSANKKHNDLYMVRIGKSGIATIRKGQISKTDYIGKVYCVSVPNKIIFVRRNGKTLFCGNTEFMPFAPSTLYEQREKCYRKIEGAEFAAKFMTITFDCTDFMKKNSPAAVHVDGTARPQLVKEEDNPSYYKIIDEYYKITGIPTIINTSFNIHEEPIVRSPHDAVRAFKDGHLDYLAIGDFLVENK